MVLTLPKEKTDDQTDEEYSSYLQDFDPAQDFLDKYTESTDPTETDFSVEAYKGDEGRGFFSPDGSGRPDEEVAEQFESSRDTPVEQPSRTESVRPVEQPSRTEPVRSVGERADSFTRTIDRGTVNRDEEPSTRPITLAKDLVGVRAENQGSASRLSGRTGGRSQFVGSRQTGTSTSFASASSANPNQTVSNSSWWSRGRDARFGSTPERQVPFGNPRQQLPRNFGGVEIDPNTLFGDDVLQRGQSDESFRAGKKPSSLIGRPDQAFNPFRSGDKGGPGSGPTPLIRQGVERGLQFAGALVPKLNAYATTANMLYKGMDAATRARTGQTLAERVSNPVATFERDAEQYKEQAVVNRAKRDEMVGGVKDWFVDKMGNVKKDVQTRQLRQAGLGTDVRGNVVSENQRIKAADDFIAGVENWEPLTDQSTFEDIPEVQGGIVDGQWDDSYQVAPEAKTEITPSVVSEFGATNQPATVDLNESTPATPPPTPEVYAEDYVSPSQPYDEQEPVGNYITNEDTGEVYPIADAPSVSESVGVLPSQEAWANPTSSDFTNPAADRAWADYQALIKKNEAENRSRYSRYSASGYGHMDDDGNYSYRYRLPFPTYTNAGESAASAAWESASQGGSYRNIPSYNVVNAHLL